jgi:hypothetical protein
MRLTDGAACCEDGFLAAATVPAAMLIKNRFHHCSAVTMVAQLPRSCDHLGDLLGSTFIPFLWAVVISAHHLLRRSSGVGQ